MFFWSILLFLYDSFEIRKVIEIMIILIIIFVFKSLYFNFILNVVKSLNEYLILI